MLLRNAASQDRDPDIFLTMTSHTPDLNATSDEHYHYGNTTETYNNNSNSLDDVWATDDSTATYPHHHQTHPYQPHYPSQHHPHQHHQYQPSPPAPGAVPSEALVSDVPRLAQSHRTAGYREGIATAKALTAQAGFDEGYGLGAAVGARAGQLVGVLEGLAAAVALHALSLGSSFGGQSQRRGEGYGQGQQGEEGGWRTGSGSGSGVGTEEAGVEEEARRLEVLLAEARQELSVRGVFAGEYWEGDGTWRYEVGGGEGAAGGGEVVFADVAEAHPLLRKWRAIVRAEAARYGVDWDILKDEAGEARRGDYGEEEATVKRENRPVARGREALAW